MSNTFHSHFQNEKLIDRTEEYAVFQLNLVEGSGTAAVYPLFHGVEMIRLDINAPQYIPNIHMEQRAIEINCCFTGRAECKMKDGCLQYIGQGDIFLTSLHNHGDSIELPLNHYSGIVLYMDLDKMDAASFSTLLGSSFSVPMMLKRLFEREECFLLQAREETNHLFDTLSHIGRTRLNYYYRLKALELMLYLENIDPSKEKRAKIYTRSQVDVTKQIEKYLTENLSNRITIEELSQKFCISTTAIKTLFKEIYGRPISIYMKDYRVQKSKELLLKSNDSISEIATKVGYESQSKFGAVFRDITGFTPYEFRKKKQ